MVKITYSLTHFFNIEIPEKDDVEATIKKKFGSKAKLIQKCPLCNRNYIVVIKTKKRESRIVNSSLSSYDKIEYQMVPKTIYMTFVSKKEHIEHERLESDGSLVCYYCYIEKILPKIREQIMSKILDELSRIEIPLVFNADETIRIEYPIRIEIETQKICDNLYYLADSIAMKKRRFNIEDLIPPTNSELLLRVAYAKAMKISKIYKKYPETVMEHLYVFLILTDQDIKNRLQEFKENRFTVSRNGFFVFTSKEKLTEIIETIGVHSFKVCDSFDKNDYPEITNELIEKLRINTIKVAENGILLLENNVVSILVSPFKKLEKI